MGLNGRRRNAVASPEITSHMQKRNADDPYNSLNVLGEQIQDLHSPVY